MYECNDLSIYLSIYFSLFTDIRMYVCMYVCENIHGKKPCLLEYGRSKNREQAGNILSTGFEIEYIYIYIYI